MALVLDPVEIRILGVLIEKQMATPDYYPLTLNAVITACNQKTNREPVMDLDEATVQEAVDRLRDLRLVWQVRTQGSRVPKYRHNLADVAEFSDRELAVLSVILLRGAQTVGELRQRTERLAAFHALPAVEHTLQKLAGREEGPFVVQLPRRPGQKENRWDHLFAEAADAGATVDPSDASGKAGLSRDDTAGSVLASEDGGEIDRLAALETRVGELEAELNELKTAFAAFRDQFI